MDWLPDELLLLTCSLEDDYASLYAVFEHDFVDTEIYFDNCKVYYQKAIDHKTPGQYPHGFTHLITKENGGQRIIDYDRATKLPWVRAIIEHADDPSVIVLNNQERSAKRGLREVTYLWLEEKDFLVVLSRINHGEYDGKIIITAYTITESYKIKQLRQLKKRLLG